MKSKGIWFIFAVAFLTRLYHIDFPVAGFHAWRQADTAAMTRNLYENGFNIFYPQIDWGGNTLGYAETEFPAFQFVVAILYQVFGPADGLGRFTSVLCSLVAIYGLYLLVRKHADETTALWSAIAYALFPANIFYSRAFMPESAMLMCTVWGVFFFSEWVDRRGARHLLLSALFICLAALIKLPSLYLGLPLLFLAWNRFGKRLFAQWRLYVFAMMVLVPVAVWYHHAHQIYLSTGLTFGIFSKVESFGPLLTLKWYNDVFFKSVAERHLTYAGFVAFLAGLFLKRTMSGERLFDWWLMGVVIYFVLVPRVHQVHEYYQLPFGIPAAVFVGKAFAAYLTGAPLPVLFQRRRIATALLLLSMALLPILSFIRVSTYMKGERRDSSLFALADAVRRHTDRGDLIVSVSERDPIFLYRCHRKGWVETTGDITDSLLAARRNSGAKYLAATKGLMKSNGGERKVQYLIQNYSVVKEGEDYFIIRL